MPARPAPRHRPRRSPRSPANASRNPPLQPLPVLILGGTAEASALARALAPDPRFAPTLSLAGATLHPAPQPIPTRVGSLGGATGLAAYLRQHRIGALIDATHPFAARITANAHLAAAATATPLCRLRRPEWIPIAGDRWFGATDMQQAADRLGPTPKRVFLTVGRQDLMPFRAAPHHHYVARSIDPPADGLLPPRAERILARPPHRLAEELALLRHHRIDVIVTKNSGGDSTRAKLDAARALHLPVIMVARPAEPAAALAIDVADALAWLGAGGGARPPSPLEGVPSKPSGSLSHSADLGE